MGWLLLVLAIEALGNVVCMLWARGGRPMPTATLAACLAIDIVLLTVLLWLTGGPFNPFSFLYLVHIALAAVVLPTLHTWVLCALAMACYGSLFLQDFLPLSIQSHLDHADQMRMHMQGMWIAFAVAAVFISYFATRVRASLAERDAELMRARGLASRGEKLASLATLATGAAHELSTPLSTIALVAKELERGFSTTQTATNTAALADDARLIRREVERCREILQQMAASAEQAGSEAFAPVPLRVLLESALDGLPRSDRVQLELGESAGCVLRAQPQAAAQALRSLVKNALQASREDQPVRIHAGQAGELCSIAVEDVGSGMSEDVLARAGEPFFTTKAQGEGMGLGLFLTRVIVERSGGNLQLRSQPGGGTTAIVAMPIAQGG
jgi:two-component system, sensor histidine kinase RegB